MESPGGIQVKDSSNARQKGDNMLFKRILCDTYYEKAYSYKGVFKAHQMQTKQDEVACKIPCTVI